MKIVKYCKATEEKKEEKKREEEEYVRGTFTDESNFITEYYERTIFEVKVLYKDGLVIPSEFNILRLPMVPLQILWFGEGAEIKLRFEEYPAFEWRFDFNISSKLNDGDLIEKRKRNGLKKEGWMDLFTIRRTEITGPQVTYQLWLYDYPAEIEFKKWTEQLCYIFNSPVNNFLFDTTTRRNRRYEMTETKTVDWFFNIQSSIESFEIRLKETSEEGMKQVLDKLRTTRNIILDFPSVDGFQHRNNTMFKTEHVVVRKAKWITIDNLLDMKNCLTITLFEHKLSEEDLNLFIQKWVDGHFPHLEYFHLKIEKEESVEFNASNVLKGIEHEYEDDVYRMFKKGEKGTDLMIWTSEGWHIYSKNGLKASVLNMEQDGCYNVNFFVWTEESMIATEDDERFIWPQLF
uniref:FBA_2 domain-containing protein n=1 Tax=Caenorhabditis tropicalis TaxID=1561998 RepID=A0A1I7TM91_9PELO